MQIINLSSSNSLLNNIVAQMRDKSIQKDPARFRWNLEKLGRIFAYEISKTLSYTTKEVVTPLGIASIPLYTDKIVAATIFRAGLPLHNGILDFFETAESAFVGMYRRHHSSGEFDIKLDYCASPSLEGKVLVLSDVMVATGSSIEMGYKALCSTDEPLATHLACPIVSLDAVEYLKKVFHGKNVTLWTTAIDEELTSHSYIVPGLGDAGDLAFGEKR